MHIAYVLNSCLHFFLVYSTKLSLSKIMQYQAGAWLLSGKKVEGNIAIRGTILAFLWRD
jgi:hypothetical protein